MADVTILQTVWFPKGEAGATIQRAAIQAAESWFAHFTGASVTLHIADDASDPNHLDMYRWRWPSATMTSTPRLGVGGSLNAAIQYVRERDPSTVIAYFAHDWELTEPLDLAPSLDMMGRLTIGAVRLGATHPGLRAHVARFDSYWFLEYDWSHGGYVFGHRPALWSLGMLNHIGPYLENASALDVERDYNERLAHDNTVWRTIVHAPNVPLWGPWRHIDTVELGEDAPEVLTARYAR